MMRSSETSRDGQWTPYCIARCENYSYKAEDRAFVAGQRLQRNPIAIPAAFLPRSGLMVGSLALHQGSIK